MRQRPTLNPDGSLVIYWPRMKFLGQRPSYTYLQFWNRDTRKRPDGVISADTMFAKQSEDSSGGTGSIAWYTRQGLEAGGVEIAGGLLYRNIE